MQKSWSELTQSRTEIEVLMQADLAELKAEPKVIEAIRNFRMGRVEVLPGGGGKYGEVRLAKSVAAEGQKDRQRSLFDF